MIGRLLFQPRLSTFDALIIICGLIAIEHGVEMWLVWAVTLPMMVISLLAEGKLGYD